MSSKAFKDCTTITSGCYLGYYRHDANGVILMNWLLEEADVPDTASCPYKPAAAAGAPGVRMV